MAQVYPVRAARPVLLLLFVLCSSLLFAQQPPTALKYPTPNVYRTNISTVALTPTVSGNVSTYSISPTLPSGLSFNTNTGAITGSPTASSAATTYTVTATNASGSTNTTLSIQVTNSYYNNANAQVSFLSANATQISGTNGGKTVGDKILYSGVTTISGQTIDCIVTTSALILGTGGTFDTYDQNATSGTNFNSNQPEFFAPQFNFGAAGSATFNFQFILGGSYNAGTNPSGTAVILQNVVSNVYDIDGNGGANSNQYVIAGDFNQYQLGSGTQLVPSLDASGRTRFRSSVNTNNGTVYADPTRVKMFHANLGNFSFTLGADGAGLAYYFVDFSVGQAFATAQTFTAPSIDLNTTATGVNNEASACSAAMPFTNGASATNEATPSNNVFDSLVVSFSTADILDGANERILVNNATAGATLSLNADFGATTVTLGGISYTATAVTRSGVRFLKFTRANSTAANIEALLDALQYSNNATSANNGTRNFTVNAFTSNFASPDAIFSATVSCVSISGNVYHDANGLTDNTVGANGTPTTAANQVYAVLVSQSTGLAVKAGVGVAAGGAYSFGTVDPGNYFIYFRNAAVTSGTAISASSYPSGSSGTYKSIGENIGATAGNDGLVDGKIVVTLGSSTVTNANFGIELPPTTASSTLSNVANPGGYNYYTVPTTGGFTYADEDGSVSSITITSFPTGANYIRLNGIIYTNGGTCPPQSACTAFPVAGVLVPVANIPAIVVDPTGAGTTSVVIPFRATDNAVVTDVNAQPSTVTINFIAQAAPIVVSGNVWDDVNGNGSKDASEVFAAPANAGQTLYALLVQTSGTYSGVPTVYASTAVTANATGYSFSNVPSGNSYEVRLASLAAQPTDGVALNTITQALATGWTDVSYNNNGSINTGLNVTNPVITLGAVTASKPNVNFGIDALPAAVTVSATSAVNPGGANNAVVPATSFSGTDAVDLAGGSISYVRLTAFPANATSITVTGALTAGGAVTTTTYTAGTFPAAGLYIATGANGNLSNANAVQVDPVNGAASVALSYKVVDAAGIESASTGTASVSFTDLVVSGSVYNDVNGGTINGPLISSAGGALYVNLVNAATNTVVASKAVSGGAYSFNTADGLQNNITTYALVLTNAATATGSTLPSTAWTYTAEGVSGTTGDGAPNGTYAFGASITASTVIDFGVDALPATTALTTAATQQNPGGTNTVTVPATAFSGTDADAANGGVISYVHITDFPANATTITLIGSTTIGGPVTTTIYTSATFPAGGVYIATAANGNLSNAAAVKVDPVNGAVNVDIPYRAVDNAGKESLASGAARQPLSDVSISGSVYDDPDAGIINGTLRSNAGGQLYVNLVSGTTLVASKAVSAAGTYSFSTADGLQNNVGDYTLVLTNTALATTSTLPSAAFTYTAEGTTGTTGDGLANGTFTFGANVTANTVIDFGIDALPTVTALTTATSQVNPGGTA
ncbi:beta strand repeat-containing protein, partial [Flaviaesturariibacter aridisoli]